MTTKGPIEPTWRFGKCLYDASLSAGGPPTLCGAVASRHLLMRDPDETWSTYVCDDHLAIAEQKLSPGDWHPVSSACLSATSVWQAGDAPGLGFCIDDELDAAAAELAADILVGNHQNGSAL